MKTFDQNIAEAKEKLKHYLTERTQRIQECENMGGNNTAYKVAIYVYGHRSKRPSDAEYDVTKYGRKEPIKWTNYFSFHNSLITGIGRGGIPAIFVLERKHFNMDYHVDSSHWKASDSLDSYEDWKKQLSGHHPTNQMQILGLDVISVDIPELKIKDWIIIQPEEN